MDFYYNMGANKIKECVTLIRAHKDGNNIFIEASGGINLSSVKDVAETGVDLISVGAITHSAPNLDLSMDIKQ